MSRHLSANDYYSEKENIVGYWHGEGAKLLGIEGMPVTKENFEAFRSNKNPVTGEKLRPRASKVAFHDVVVSAPKCVSVVALVGGDERVIEAFDEVSHEVAFKGLEAFAEARYRAGSSYNTEDSIRTGNTIAAVYYHDTSRLLGPQLHKHYALSNHTYTEHGFRALDVKTMMEQSKEIRIQTYRALAAKMEKMGYEIEWRENSFGIAGLDINIEKIFSERAQQRNAFEERYLALFGREPTKKRIEQFIKEVEGDARTRFRAEFEQAFSRKPTQAEIRDFVKNPRSKKMAHSTREEVRKKQLASLTTDQQSQIHQVVANARLNQMMEIQSRTDNVVTIENSIEQRLTSGVDVKSTEKLSMPTLPVQSEPLSTGNQKASRKKNSSNTKGISRTELIRRMRRADTIFKALQGHPSALIAESLLKITKNRHRR